MLDKIFEALVEHFIGDKSVEFIVGNTNAMVVEIDGERFLIQKQ